MELMLYFVFIMVGCLIIAALTVLADIVFSVIWHILSRVFRGDSE